MEQKKSSEKDYRKQSPQYFLIGLIVALSTTLLAFEYRTESSPIVISEFDEGEYVLPYELPPLVLPKPKDVPIPPKPPVPPVPSPDPIIDPLPEPDPEPLVVEPIKTTSVYSAPDPEPLVDEVVRIPEQMPEYPGGELALYKFLGSQMHYPAMAQENGLESKLYVQFIVNSDGSISDIEILNPQGFGFDKEAIRVVSKMPNWKPGKQGGKKVRVFYVIPLIFALK